jgi:hypothetical protein
VSLQVTVEAVGPDGEPIVAAIIGQIDPDLVDDLALLEVHPGPGPEQWTLRLKINGDRRRRDYDDLGQRLGSALTRIYAGDPRGDYWTTRGEVAVLRLPFLVLPPDPFIDAPAAR